MKHNRRFIILIIIFAAALLACLLYPNQNAEKDLPIPSEIENAATAVKIEYADEEPGSYRIFIPSYMKILTAYFNGYMTPIDKEFEENWKFRVTYTDTLEVSEDKVIVPEDANVYIVLVGEQTVGINGRTYSINYNESGLSPIIYQLEQYSKLIKSYHLFENIKID